MLRTVLSLTGEHDRLVKGGGPGLRGHIVAELADIDNEPLVRMVGQQSRVFTVTRCVRLLAAPQSASRECVRTILARLSMSHFILLLHIDIQLVTSAARLLAPSQWVPSATNSSACRQTVPVALQPRHHRSPDGPVCPAARPRSRLGDAHGFPRSEFMVAVSELESKCNHQSVTCLQPASQPPGADANLMGDAVVQDEFYLQAWPSLAGRRFAEVLLMFECALPLGVKPAATGEVMMNPSDDYVFAEGGYDHRAHPSEQACCRTDVQSCMGALHKRPSLHSGSLVVRACSCVRVWHTRYEV